MCPNCMKPHVVVTATDIQEKYYQGKRAPENRAECSSCFASFENYDDGSSKRNQAYQTEMEERAELARLKQKYESDPNE